MEAQLIVISTRRANAQTTHIKNGETVLIVFTVSHIIIVSEKEPLLKFLAQPGNTSMPPFVTKSSLGLILFMNLTIMRSFMLIAKQLTEKVQLSFIQFRCPCYLQLKSRSTKLVRMGTAQL